MSCDDPAIERFEHRLAQAAAAFADDLRRFIGSSGCAAKGRHGGMETLEAEDARLCRMARRNASSYDLNRHIAIRRLLAMRGAQLPLEG